MTDPEVLVQPEAVHWDQDSDGLVSVVVVQACCARLAAAKSAETRAARCAILKRQKVVRKKSEEKECSAEPDLLMMRMMTVQIEAQVSGMLSILIPRTPDPLSGRAAHTFGRNPPWLSATRLYRWSEAVATEKSAGIPPSTLVRCASTAILQMGSGLGTGPNSILSKFRDWLRLKSTACVTVAAMSRPELGRRRQGVRVR